MCEAICQGLKDQLVRDEQGTISSRVLHVDELKQISLKAQGSHSSQLLAAEAAGHSQQQAVIKLLEKRGKDKRYIKNWRPISLINFDAKLLSKALAERLKAVLPSIIKHDQTAYVYNRFIGESVRVVSDVLEITKTMDIEGYILTMDIEKAFDSVDHPFLFATLERIGFDPYFLD